MNQGRAPDLVPLGDSALVVSFGDAIDEETHARVLTFVDQLEAAPLPEVVDCVPAYASVTIHYRPGATGYDGMESAVRTLASRSAAGDSAGTHNDVTIPVCYGDEFGPDLDFVARHNELTSDEVVRLHSSASYVVYMIGFAPGFPYLGGLPDKLATPRLEEPRAVVPQGSVGIAGAQTGVYPIATPGGWRIIGRTPLRLFDATAPDPSLLHAGDRVSFRPIDRAAFDAYADGGP